MGDVLVTKYSGVSRYQPLYVGLVFLEVAYTPVKSERAGMDLRRNKKTLTDPEYPLMKGERSDGRDLTQVWTSNH